MFLHKSISSIPQLKVGKLKKNPKKHSLVKDAVCYSKYPKGTQICTSVSAWPTTTMLLFNDLRAHEATATHRRPLTHSTDKYKAAEMNSNI